jgi:sugar phosphate isomerase/epimerase
VKDDPADTIRKLGPLIRHVHLEDIAATRVHHHMIPGEGVIDFATTLTALKEIGYNDWVTIELYTCHENPDHAAKLARERVLKIASAVEVTFDLS